jgi:D-alanyl-D-alanine dipeptidase
MKALALCFTLVTLVAATTAAPLDLLHSARQLVLVVTPGWDDVRGEVRRFERRATGEAWRAVGAPTSIVVGKNGSAWDPLVDPVVPGPVKAEGDGRSPAGIFTLGTAFGFAPAAEASWTKLPYLHLTEGIECVDDVKSSVYNQLVDRRTVKTPDWSSSEKMREVAPAYQWGVVVNYNSPATAGRGSCIFLHIGGEGGKGTAGCTAMPQADLESVMSWLDPKLQPVLVQFPRAVYDKLKSSWQLP